MAQRKIAIVIELKGTIQAKKGFDKVSSSENVLAAKTTKVNATLKTLDNTIKRLNPSTRKLSQLQMGLTNSFIKGNLAARAISVAYVNITRAMKFGAKQFIDFEFSMAKIKAITGVTGKNFKTLETRIRDIAKVSPKTAAQVADAGLAMGKLGLSSKELEVSLEEIVQTSVVLDESVEAVGETVIQVKNAFELSASDIASVNEKLFAGIANSALTLEKFSTAFSFSGAAAKGAGVDIGELIAVMGVLVDSGVKASTVGTQLRQVFVKLSDESFKASQGISGMTVKNDGLSAIIKKLNKDSLGTVDIYDQYGLRAISVVEILQRMGDKFENLKDKVNGSSGVLEEASGILEKTVKVNLLAVSSAFGDLAQEIGKVVDGPLGTWAKGTRKQLELLTTAIKAGRDLVVFLKERNEFRKYGGEKDKGNPETDPKVLARIKLANALAVRKNDVLRDARNITELGLKLEKEKNKELENKTKKNEKDRIDRLSAIKKELKAILQIERARKAGLLPGVTDSDQARAFGSVAERALAEGDMDTGIAATEAINAIERNQLLEEEVRLKEQRNEFDQSLITILNGSGAAEERRKKAKDVELKQLQKEKNIRMATLTIINSGASVIGSLASIFKTNSTEFKALALTEAITQAGVNTLLAFENGLEANKGKKWAYAVAVAQAAAAAAAGAAQVSNIANAADGFEGQVNRETIFRAGEAGPEQVSIKPRSDTSEDGGGSTKIVFEGDVYGMDGFTDKVNEAMEQIERNYV